MFNKPSIVNDEVKAVLQPATLSHDNRIVEKQQKVSAGLGATAKSLADLTRDRKDERDLAVIECLSDAIKIIVDVQRDETIIRRSLF